MAKTQLNFKMAKKKFNIPALYQQVFGITGVRFAIPNTLVEGVAKTAAEAAIFAAGQRLNDLQYNGPRQYNPYTGIETIPIPNANIQSVLGTPIYEQITLNIPATVKNGVVTSQPFTYTFPDWPLFDISPAWMIKKENTQGGEGSVKEFISQDDSVITIRGFLINNDSQDYPEQLLSDWWKMANCRKSIGITSRVFNLLDIHNIVILDARLIAVEGYMNMQPFEMDCLSNYPRELVIKSVKTQRAIVPGL
jgi:hypothetical protein